MLRGIYMICRVHWLLYNLNREFKSHYKLSFNYEKHRYMFYRMNGKKIKDVFIVVRTSKRCWKVSYANDELCQYDAFSCKKSINVARRMWYIFKISEKLSTSDRG